MDIVHSDLHAYVGKLHPNISLAHIDRITQSFRATYFEKPAHDSSHCIKVENFFEGEQIDKFMDVMFDAHSRYEGKKNVMA